MPSSLKTVTKQRKRPLYLRCMSPVNEGACLSRVLATYESQIEFTTEDIIHERYVASKRILRGGIGEGKARGGIGGGKNESGTIRRSMEEIPSMFENLPRWEIETFPRFPRSTSFPADEKLLPYRTGHLQTIKWT